MYELAGLRYRQGYLAEAEHQADAAIACFEQTFGPGHVSTVDATAIRILIWCEQGRYDEAERLARRLLERRSALHQPTSPAVDNAMHHLARVLYERGKLDEAIRVERNALHRREALVGHDSGAVAGSLEAIGDIQLAGGDPRAAEPSYREAVRLWRDTMGGDHPYVAEALRGLAEAIAAQGRLAEARRLAEQALAQQQQHLRPGHPAIASTLIALGVIEPAGSPAAAERFRDALAIRRAALPPDHPYTAVAESLLGECLALQRRPGEAQPLLDHAAQVLRARLGDDHPATRRAERRRLAAVSPAATAVPIPAGGPPCALPGSPGGCDRPAAVPAPASPGVGTCPATCSGEGCKGCDPRDELCDSRPLIGEVGIERWPDPGVGPERVDAAVHKTRSCGGAKWAFATTNHVCDVFSTWLEDAEGRELPNTRYDSRNSVLQIYGNMWTGAVRACASVCGKSVCSPVDR
jgi:tetratricopeptide (TPR) repeat protein